MRLPKNIQPKPAKPTKRRLPKGKETPSWMLEMTRGCLEKQRARNQRAEEELKFLDGEQWTPEQQRTLRAQNRPDYVDNQLFVMNELYEGIETQRHLAPKLVPRGLEDVEGAEILNHQFDALWGKNGGEDFYCTVSGWARTYGWGWAKVYRNWNIGEEKICFRDVDPRLALIDPKSRNKDPNKDAGCMGERMWISFEEACRRWPDCEKDFASMMAEVASRSLDEFGDAAERIDFWTSTADHNEGLIALPSIEFWDDNGGLETVNPHTGEICMTVMQYRHYEDRFWLLYDGQEEELTFPPDVDEEQGIDLLSEWMLEQTKQGRSVEIQKVPTKTIREAVFIGPLLITDDLAPFGGKLFTYVPRWCYRDRHGEPYGVLKNFIDPQKKSNKIDSKILEILATKRVRARQSSVGKMSVDDIAEEAAKPNSVFILKDDINGIAFDTDYNLAAQFFQMGESTKQGFRVNSGLNDEVRGQGSKDQAFVTLQARRDQGLTAITRVLREGELFMHRLTKTIIQAMRWEYAGKPNVMRAKNASGGYVWAATGIDPNSNEANRLAELASKSGFPFKVCGDISNIETDVEITVQPHVGTEREAQRDRKIEWMKAIPHPVGQLLFAASAVENDDMPDAKDLAQMLRMLAGVQMAPMGMPGGVQPGTPPPGAGAPPGMPPGLPPGAQPPPQEPQPTPPQQ